VDDPQEPQIRIVDRRWWAQKGQEGREGQVGQAGQGGDPLRKPTYVEELEQRLTAKASEFQALVADHRRSLDEFEQARVRIRRDVAREVERGKRAILADLLDVVDNLERAIQATREPQADVAPVVARLAQGVELVRDQFLARLQAHGVTRIDALGKAFDATRHEAISTMDVDDAGRDGVVVAVVREGYTIGDDVLRPASVVVGQRRP